MATLQRQTAHQQQTSRPRVYRSDEAFFVLCPSPAEQHGLITALYSLYYLPRNYKLVVMTADAADEQSLRTLAALVNHPVLADRVIFDSEAGLPERVSPFSYADVVLASSDRAAAGATAAHYVNAHELSSPEAVASAVLKISRL